jgi:hypothetical protein
MTDFYSGYEGEPELVFALQGFPSEALHAWEGYVDAVLRAVPPGPEGAWEGLLLPYHLAIGCWGNEKETAVVDLPLLAAQLSAIDASDFWPEAARFHQTLQALIRRAIKEGQILLISRF